MAEWRRRYDPPLQAAHVPAGVLDRHIIAHSVADLVRAVVAAERDGVPIRACGNHWAMSEAVCEQGFGGRLVETRALNATVYGVVPRCLSGPVRRLLAAQPAPPAGTVGDCVHTVYHVQAGVALYDLYTRLDRRDPRWPVPTDHLHPHLTLPWAMPTLPAACGQTLVGALSTASHGTDLDRPPLADAVQAIHLVAAGGHQFWIERSRYRDDVDAPLSDPDLLRATLRDVDGRGLSVLQDDDLLDAALVSVGRMGLIYSAVLRVIGGHGVEETRVRRTWSAVRRELTDHDGPLFAGRGLQVVINPLPRGYPPEHSCWVTRRRSIPLPINAPRRWRGRSRRGSPGTAGRRPPVDVGWGNPFVIVSSALSLRWVATAAGVVGQAVAIAAHLGRAPRPVVVGLAVTVGMLLAAAQYRGSLGDLAAATVNRVADHGPSPVLAWMLDRFIAAEQREHGPAQPLRDVSYAVLDRHNYADRCGVTDGDALEVAFDGRTDLAVRFVDECVLGRVAALLRPPAGGRPRLGASYVNVRFTGVTRTHLGMQRWPRTCAVAVAGLRGFAGSADLLDALERDGLRLGGLVHWGQRNQLTRAQVAVGYPRLPAWRTVLRRLSAHGGTATFSTAYTRQVGLEPW